MNIEQMYVIKNGGSMNLSKTNNFLEKVENNKLNIDSSQSKRGHGAYSLAEKALYFGLRTAVKGVVIVAVMAGVYTLNHSMNSSDNHELTSQMKERSINQNTHLEIKKPREKRKNDLENKQITMLELKFANIKSDSDYAGIRGLIDIISPEDGINFSKFKDDLLKNTAAIQGSGDSDSYQIKANVLEDLSKIAIAHENEGTKTLNKSTLLQEYKNLQKYKLKDTIENTLGLIPRSDEVLIKIEGKKSTMANENQKIQNDKKPALK